MAGFSIVIMWLLLVGIFVFVLLLFVLSTYLLESIFIMRVNRRMREDRPALAWIPLYGQYLLGKIANARILGIILAVDHALLLTACACIYIAGDAIMFLFGVMGVLTVLGYVLKIIIAHRVFRIADPANAALLTIANLLTFGLLRLVLFLVYQRQIIQARNRVFLQQTEAVGENLQ